MNNTQRIRRIQRWLAAANPQIPDCHYLHTTPTLRSNRPGNYTRLDRAEKLFAVELEWLVRYSLLATEALRSTCVDPHLASIVEMHAREVPTDVVIRGGFR